MYFALLSMGTVNVLRRMIFATLVATVFSGGSGFLKPSCSLLVSPFESSLSDVSGGHVASGVADDLVVEIAVTAMGEAFGYEHKDSFS